MTTLMASIFNCGEESYPIWYLGIPIRAGRSKRSDWLPVIERVEKRLAGWKCISLSLRRPSHPSQFSAVHHPDVPYVLLWASSLGHTKDWQHALYLLMTGRGGEGSKGYHLVNWKRACKKKEYGGLGVMNLRDMNRALLCKWWWKLYSHSSAKWTSFIQVYCRRKKVRFGGTFYPEKFPSSGKVWLKLESLYKWASLVTLRTSGMLVFWEDKWCSDVPFRYFLPNLFEAAENKSTMVADYWHNGQWRPRIDVFLGHRWLLSFKNSVRFSVDLGHECL